MVDCADILEQLKVVFEAFDADGRGSIEVDHFCEIAKKHFGEDKHKEITGLIQLLDPEGCGQISFNSFCDGVQVINDMATIENTCNDQERNVNMTSLTLDECDGHAEDENSTASTYNEYDDSVMTDMSEENIVASPFLSEGTGQSIDGDDDDSAIANGMTRLRTDFDSILSKSFTDDEEQYEDYGENTDIECDLDSTSPVQVYIEDIDKDTESIATTSTVVCQDRRLVTLKRDVWSKCEQYNGTRRVTSNEFASQLYRSSSSNNLQNGVMSNGLGDYAASESDVLELSDRVRELENQVVDLEEVKASGNDLLQKMRSETTHLREQLNQMEEQIRETDIKIKEEQQEIKNKHKEAMSKQEKELRSEIDNLQSQIAEIEDERNDFLGDLPKIKKENESLRKERDRLMKAFREADDKWFSLSSEFQRQQQQYRIEKEELEEELATNAVLIDEMNVEIEDLRRYREETQQMNLMRSNSLLDMPGRFQELDIQFKQVKQENALLKESNDELNAQVISTTGVTFSAHLLHSGVSKAASFAAEIETASKDDIMQALRDEEKISVELREYIGHILTRILEHNPSLLEIQPRSKSSSSKSS
ncbi:rab11 family-interacting protein 4-like isoform X2 [Antedon mediterranea]|uniref:rab11 family-interacting protein 4-like isoform X2 n=1 Tax=Antedon mediterranea TaxID=105859 RepID=UPI003AF4D94A